MDMIYANQFTVSTSENEIFVRFGSIVPSVDEKGEVIGSKLADEKLIVLSPAAFKGFKELMNSIPM